MPATRPRLGARFALLATLPALLALAPIDAPREAPREAPTASTTSTTSTTSTASPAATPSLGDRDFADPFVLRDGRDYYAFATGASGINIQAARSSDLTTWVRLADALPKLPKWAASYGELTWAPSVLARGPKYVLYYTTRDAKSGFQCISRATSRRPEGPYEDASDHPFVCQVAGEASFCGSIDPSPFVDASGRPFLLWKSDENSASCAKAPRIWSQPLSDDGVDVLGAPTPLVAMDQTWEGPIIEGPSMMVHDGRYYLFYSANRYESADYAIGYASCAGPTGPCRKVTTREPLWKSTEAILGPGGQEFFTDPNGLTWMAYHAWTAPKASYGVGGARSLRVAPVTFTDGTPVLADPKRAQAQAQARASR